MDEEPEEFDWNGEPDAIHKVLGWGCLLLLLIPIVIFLYGAAVMMCDYGC